MKVLSLFDGISCARVALGRAGIPVEAYYASEIDKYATQISEKNYPEIVRLGSVVEINDVTDKPITAIKQGSVTLRGKIDLLIGGSPCQDLSIAKKNRKGLDGERSGLFWEYVRILKEVKPKYFILENVASMPKEAKQVITKALGVEPIMINASLVSAQNRKRLFWTNIPNVTLPEDKGILLKDILEEGIGEDKSYCVPATYYKENIKSLQKRKKKGLIVWNERGLEKLKSNTVRSSGRGSGIGDKHNWDTIRIGHLNSGGQGDRIYSPEGKSVGLSALGGGRGAKTGLYLTDSIVRKLTPIECERLQGLPDNYTEGVSNTQRYKALGNAFNVDVVTHILSFIK